MFNKLSRGRTFIENAVIENGGSDVEVLLVKMMPPSWRSVCAFVKINGL